MTTHAHQTYSQPLISTKPSQHASLDLTNPPPPSIKSKGAKRDHLEREIELLKRDNGLMSVQLEQCERQH